MTSFFTFFTSRGNSRQTSHLKRKLAALCGVALLTAGLATAHAQSGYPNRPITLVIPYPPGGPTDIVSRLVAVEMSKTIGQNIIVDNRPGASGMIGADFVARAAPDGYTLLANASLQVINPYLYKDMRYDSLKDFVPITQLADVPLILVVPEDSPVHSVQDLVELGRKQPLNFGSAGTASAQQLAGELFRVRTGLPMQHVPYKGSAPALTDLMSGQIQFMFDSMPSATPFIKSGKLRAIAVTVSSRVAEFPNIPTMEESGFKNFNVSTWYGLWAPKGTPPSIVAKLAEHAAHALRQPNVVTQYTTMGAKPVGSDPATFAAFNLSENKKWRDIVQAAGITPQ